MIDNNKTIIESINILEISRFVNSREVTTMLEESLKHNLNFRKNCIYKIIQNQLISISHDVVDETTKIQVAVMMNITNKNATLTAISEKYRIEYIYICYRKNKIEYNKPIISIENKHKNAYMGNLFENYSIRKKKDMVDFSPLNEYISYNKFSIDENSVKLPLIFGLDFERFDVDLMVLLSDYMTNKSEYSIWAKPKSNYFLIESVFIDNAEYKVSYNVLLKQNQENKYFQYLTVQIFLVKDEYCSNVSSITIYNNNSKSKFEIDVKSFLESNKLISTFFINSIEVIERIKFKESELISYYESCAQLDEVRNVCKSDPYGTGGDEPSSCVYD